MTTMNSQMSYVVTRYPNVGYEIVNLPVSTFLQQRTVSRLSCTTLQSLDEDPTVLDVGGNMLFTLRIAKKLPTTSYSILCKCKLIESSKQPEHYYCLLQPCREIHRTLHNFQLQNVLNVCPGEITGYARSDLLLLRTTFQHKSVNIVIENEH